jgi:cytoskeleton-associated protein 5
VKENLEDGSLDPRILLLDIDRFLQAIPPAEWRRRASDGIPLSDMPLRTVKTILQQVVATYGDTVYEQLALLDKAESSFVYQYLFRLLNNSRSVSESLSATTNSTAPMATPSQSSSRFRQSRRSPESDKHGDQESGNGLPAGGAASTVMSPTRSNDIEMNLALKDIFDKIGNAQASKVGIAELYQFKLQHPE